MANCIFIFVLALALVHVNNSQMKQAVLLTDHEARSQFKHQTIKETETRKRVVELQIGKVSELTEDFDDQIGLSAFNIALTGGKNDPSQCQVKNRTLQLGKLSKQLFSEKQNFYSISMAATVRGEIFTLAYQQSLRKQLTLTYYIIYSHDAKFRLPVNENETNILKDHFNFTMKKFSLESDPLIIQNLQFKNFEQLQSAKLVYYPQSDSIYMIGRGFAFVFSATVKENQEKLQFTLVTSDDYQKQSLYANFQISKILLSGDKIFMSSKNVYLENNNTLEDCILIYELQSNGQQILYRNSISAIVFDLTTLSIVDFSIDENFVALLTKEGIYFAEITLLNSIQRHDIFIPITNGTALGQYKRRIFLIATIPDQIKIKEVYLDWGNQKYYINRQLPFAGKIQQIVMHEEYALITSLEISLLFYYGLQKWHITDMSSLKQQGELFQEDNVQESFFFDLIRIGQPNEPQRYLFARQVHSFSLAPVQFFSPFLRCSYNTTDDSMAKKTQMAVVTLNSTICQEGSKKELNYFQDCELSYDIEISFNLTKEVVWKSNYEKYWLLATALVIVLIVFTSLTLWACARTHKKMVELQTELHNFKKKYAQIENENIKGEDS